MNPPAEAPGAASTAGTPLGCRIPASRAREHRGVLGAGGPPGCRGRRGSPRKHLPVPRRAQSPGPGRRAQVLGGGVGTAWAGGAPIAPGRLRA